MRANRRLFKVRSQVSDRQGESDVLIPTATNGSDWLDYGSVDIYTILVSPLLYFQRKITGSALICSKYRWMRSTSSCLVATRIPRSMLRAILLNMVSTMFSHDPCFGVKTNSNRWG